MRLLGKRVVGLGFVLVSLTAGLAVAGVPIWGTPPDSIDLAEDRGRFGQLLRDLDIDHPGANLVR